MEKKKFVYRFRGCYICGLTSTHPMYMEYCLEFLDRERNSHRLTIYNHDEIDIKLSVSAGSSATTITLFTHIERDDFLYAEENSFDSMGFDERYFIPVSALNLSSRHENIFRAGEIEFLGDLISYTETDLLKFRCYGKTSVQELKKALSSFGLDFFSTSLPNWPKFDERRQKGIVFPEVDVEKYKV